MLDAINLLPRVPRGLFDDSVAYAGPGRAFVASSLTNLWDEISVVVEPNRNALKEWFDSATNDVIVVDLS